MLIGCTFTNNNAGRTGLSPTINIYDLSDDSLTVSAEAMNEVAEGGYDYDFSSYDASKSYYWVADAGASVPTRERYKRGWTSITADMVNAEVVDCLNVDTYAEPGQGEPPATASIVTKIGLLYKRLINEYTETDGQGSIYNNAGTTVDHKATISDDGTTFTKGKYRTGP